MSFPTNRCPAIPAPSGYHAAIGLVLVAAALLAGCSHEKQASSPPSPETPVPVKVERLAVGSLAIEQEATGTVEARTRAVLAAQVMGVIRQVHVEVGQSVRAGQLLVTLEARELQTALGQAQAARAEAQSAQPEVEKAIEAARVQLDLAETSHQRIAALFAKKSVSPQEMDESKARLRAAQLALEQAQTRRGQTEARVETAARAIASAQVLTGYATIAAPFDGLVTEKMAQAGSLAAPGTPLLAVEKAGGYQLALTTDESRPLRLGQRLTVTWEDGSEVATSVTEIVPAIDPATRVQIVKAALPAVPGLRSGRFGRARWAAGERTALSIPAGALLERGQLQMVLVVENERLRSRMITAGETRGARREVLSGLQPGDLVVVQPPPEWKDGAPARVQP